jgi:hypothetical protein
MMVNRLELQTILRNEVFYKHSEADLLKYMAAGRPHSLNGSPASEGVPERLADI